MPKIQCPYPKCTYETEDVSNALAAVLLSVHSAGAHDTHATQVTATQQQTPTTTARVEKVRRATISTAGTGEVGHILSLVGKIT